MTLDELRRRQEGSHAGRAGALPSSRSLALYSAWLRGRAALHNAAVAVYNGTWGWVGDALPYRKAVVPMNHAELMDVLLRIHGHQVCARAARVCRLQESGVIRVVLLRACRSLWTACSTRTHTQETFC